MAAAQARGQAQARARAQEQTRAADSEAPSQADNTMELEFDAEDDATVRESRIGW